MTDFSEFTNIANAKGVAAPERTLRLWYHLYTWVEKTGYADTADTPEFVEYVRSFRRIAIGTINSHLRRMSANGLLKRHTLRRRLPPELREELLNPVSQFIFGAEALPSSFARYCLPGHICSREFKSAARSQEKMEARISELHQRNAP